MINKTTYKQNKIYTYYYHYAILQFVLVLFISTPDSYSLLMNVQMKVFYALRIHYLKLGVYK